MFQNSNFRLPSRHGFFPKNGSYGYGAKSRWGPLRVHLGASGVPLGKKRWVKTIKNYHAPKFEFLITPQSSYLFGKNGSYGCGAKSRWGPLGSILGPSGSHWFQKMGQNRRKLPCPKIRIFDYPAVIDFSQKMEITVLAPNHGGDPLGFILGPMGSHWVQKMGQNRKKLPCPKIRIFDYPAVIGFSQKMEVTVMAPNQGGDPPGSILGSVGSNWVKEMGQNRRKLPCPKIRIFDYAAVIDFSQKMEITVVAPNHGGDH